MSFTSFISKNNKELHEYEIARFCRYWYEGQSTASCFQKAMNHPFRYHIYAVIKTIETLEE